ncbi:hypothetical protein [Candidatus Manganitrophus noduliformans]|uniref:Uncharacterized protein n=1 Tax=Candidatus Manganitrophus noduliformans TaxID=2606439 RepID=A0A7X6I9B3_9BACT|nr:hypothetical protein [Candidatus Manganitrophus noduliformans]NKE69293.1 hypothetical protein [Candidatus Manganitrophus noduliformans]
MKPNGILLPIVALYAFVLLPLSPLFAEEGGDPASDTIAPSIRHEPPDQAVVAGLPFVLQAVITDNVGVEEVTLYYRLKGTEEYSPLQMKRVSQDLFAVALPSQEVSSGQIEYYIQTNDPSGNISFRGFSFTPLTVAIVAAPPLRQDAAPSEPSSAALERITLRREDASPPWYKKWWVWTIVGAAVIAGGVAVAGHGGTDGRDDGEGGGAPTTGSVAIVGPAVGQ